MSISYVSKRWYVKQPLERNADLGEVLEQLILLRWFAVFIGRWYLIVASCSSGRNARDGLPVIIRCGRSHTDTDGYLYSIDVRGMAGYPAWQL